MIQKYGNVLYDVLSGTRIFIYTYNIQGNAYQKLHFDSI